MITIDTRPMTPKEKRLLRAMSRAPAEESIAVPFIVLCVVLALLAFAVSTAAARFPLVDRFENPLVVCAGALAVGAALWVRVRNIRALSDPRLLPDLRDGRAEVLNVEPVDVIRVEQFEDEGVGFLVDLGNGRALFLQGQHLEPMEKKRRFPCQAFTVVRSAHSKEFLSLNCTGAHLPSSQTIGPFRPDGKLPDNAEIVDCDWETLKREGPNQALNRTA